MSLVRPALNAWLRYTEKPYLARVEAPEELRARFLCTARLWFHAPLGTQVTDTVLADRRARAVRARGVQPDAPVMLYFHGGAYIFGAPRTHQAMLGTLSALSGWQAILPRYRLAPEHPFPAALDDAVAAYKALRARHETIVVGGDSAGGGLALALLGEILAQGLPRPAGLFGFSSLTDLTYSGDSVTRNAEADVLLPLGRAAEQVEMYLQGADPTDPRASPLFADFTGAPPVWLCAGTTEALLDDTRRMTERMRAQGVTVTERIALDLPHVWPLFHNVLPEARRTLRDVAGWINSLSFPQADS